MTNNHAEQLLEKIENKSALVGIIGLGYVGLPLALAFTEKGFRVLGLDVDQVKVDKINSGDCYIKHLDPSRLARAIARGNVESQAAVDGKSEIQIPNPPAAAEADQASSEGGGHEPPAGDGATRRPEADSKSEISGGAGGNSEFRVPNSEFEASDSPKLVATTDFSRLSEADAILICVPTPLGPHKEPDMRYVEESTRAIHETLRPGQLVILESTTYPGTTDELLMSILEAPHPPNEEDGGLKCGEEFFLAFSPEREDPGNQSYGTTNTPKLVGGVDTVSGDLAEAFYDQVVSQTVRVASARVAEAAKLTENIFRSVNIALVNELKIIYDRLGLDIWDVLDAAETKPFGFMRFNPGPGLGGHCIPLDPFYLAWRAREAGVPTRFIELAGEINTSMPGYVIEKLQAALNEHGKAVKGAKILILGLAYKPNIDDPRESPSFEIIDRLLELGAEVSYHDPHIPVAPTMRSWPDLPPMNSVDLNAENLAAADAALLVTDHRAVDYDLILEHAPLLIDTRGVYRDQNGKVHSA